MRYSFSRLITVCGFGLPLLLALNTVVAQAGSPSKVTVCHIPPDNPANFHAYREPECREEPSGPWGLARLVPRELRYPLRRWQRVYRGCL